TRGMDTGETQMGRGDEERQQGLVQLRIELPAPGQEAIPRAGDTLRMGRLLQREQVQMRGEVRDIDCRLGHRRIVEIQYREAVAVGQDLVMVKVPMDRQGTPAFDVPREVTESG